MQKKHILLLLSLLLLTYCVAKPEYGIKFEKETIDFGEADPGSEAEMEYVFENTGKQTLVISNVRPACGCTVAGTWDKEVEPGEKGKIPIVFKTQGYIGDITKSVVIQTNVPEQETMTLFIKGYVNTPVSIEPRSAYLGDVGNTTGALHGSFTIENHSDEPLNITEIVPPNEKTTYTLEVIEEQQKYKLNFTVNPPFTGSEGVARKAFILKTDSKKQPYFYPTFSYFIAPPVQVYPMKIMVNLADLKNNALERRINIRSHIEEPIAVTDVNINGSEQVEWDVKEVNKDQFLQIVVKLPEDFTFPTEGGGVVSVQFKVHNDPQDLVYTVTVEEYTVPQN